ncbi:MAG: alanine--glyoxylate aminotransferase family protein [Nitrososphaerota archaeon]
MLLMIPGPTDLDERVIKAMSRQMIDHRSQDFRDVMRSIEENAKKVYGTSSNVYVLTASGTGGVEAAASNLTEVGDGVLIPVSGLFGERMAEAFEAYGARVFREKLPDGDGPTPEFVATKLDEHRDVSMVGFPYNDTSTGIIGHDLEGIVRICHSRGKLVVVDAVSILGGAKMPVDQIGIDVCVTGSQKCLAAPPGLALVSVSQRAWEKIEQKKTRPPYFDLVKYRHFLDERMETPFTPAVPLFWGLDEALKIIVEIGVERWIGRHQSTSAALYAGLDTFGLNFYSGARFRSPTVAAMHIPQGLTDAAIREKMARDFGILIAGGLGPYKGKMFRVANIGNVRREKILRTIEALGKTLTALGLNVDAAEAVEVARSTLDKTWPG